MTLCLSERSSNTASITMSAWPKCFPQLVDSSVRPTIRELVLSKAYFVIRFFLTWRGRKVGGWVGGWMEEEKAVWMRCCRTWVGGRVGGWVTYLGLEVVANVLLPTRNAGQILVFEEDLGGWVGGWKERRRRRRRRRRTNSMHSV